MKQPILCSGIWLALALTWGTVHPLQAQDAPSPNTEQLLRQIERLVSHKDFAQAYQQAHILVAANPEKAEAWFWLGQTAGQEHRIREALAAFDKALALKKEYPEALYQLGQLHAQLRKWREAIAAYQQALQLRPDWVDAYVALGEVYFQNGAYKEAIETLEQALVYEPAHPLALRLIELCRKAMQEEEFGVVPVETLEQLAFLSSQDPAPQTRTRDLNFQQPSPTIAVPLHIGFPPGKYAVADLPPNGQEQLRQVVRLLQTSAWKGRQILIEGHTCRCGTPEKNKSLAYQRAAAVKDYLIEQGGVSAQAVSIISYGEEQPLSADGRDELTPEQCALDEEHSMDQRVVIRQGQNPLVGETTAQVSFWYRHKAESQFQRLTEGATLHSGDEIKFYLLSQQSLYAYIFHRGPKGDWTCLFPNPDFCLEAPPTNPVEAGRQYWLPRFGSGAPLDDTPGPESTFVYLSLEPEPEMEKWVREGIPGTMPQPGTRGVARMIIPDSMEWFAQIHFQHEP